MKTRMQESGSDNNETDWSTHYKSAETEIKDTLKKGNADLTSQLEKVYQGILKNCIQQSGDEHHKM